MTCGLRAERSASVIEHGLSYDSLMSDVFISYAKEDRARAAGLAAVLESKGWTVWWDRYIPPGRTFDEVIEEALTTTRCVIVLWSALSVASRWVRAEASVAGERGILVPVLIEDVDQPLEFRRIQTANLVNWHGEPDDPELQHLLGTVSQIVSAGTEAMPSFRASMAASKPITPRSQWPHFAAVALAGVLIGAGLVYSLTSRADDADNQAEPAPQTEASIRATQAMLDLPRLRRRSGQRRRRVRGARICCRARTADICCGRPTRTGSSRSTIWRGGAISPETRRSTGSGTIGRRHLTRSRC